MKVVVKWADGAMVVGEPGSGHTVVMNVPRDLGGRNPGQPNRDANYSGQRRLLRP